MSQSTILKARLIEAMRSARPLPERFVWMCLEYQAFNVGWVRMSEKDIGAETRASRSSVRRAIIALVRDGIIRVQRYKRRPTLFQMVQPLFDHAELSVHREHSNGLGAHPEHSTTRENGELSVHHEHSARAGLESKKDKKKEREVSMSIKSRKTRLDDVIENDAWAAFWQAYPRKVGKRAAAKAWTAATKRATPDQILAGLAHAQWSDDPQFIPHPATWLNGDRWLDEPDPPKQTLREQWNLGSFLTPHFDDETPADYDATFTTPKPKGFLQ